MALVGLNYSVDGDETFALLLPGNVSVPALDQIYPVGFGEDPQNELKAQLHTANRQWITICDTSYVQANGFQLRQHGSRFRVRL